MVKNLPAIQETEEMRLQSLGQGDPLEQEMAAQPACKCKRLRHRFDARDRNIPWRRAWQPTSVFLPGENPMDRGASWAMVHRVTKSWTQLSDLAFTHT